MVSEPGSSEPELKLPQTHCSLLSSNPNQWSSLHPVQPLMKKKTEAWRVLMVPHPVLFLSWWWFSLEAKVYGQGLAILVPRRLVQEKNTSGSKEDGVKSLAPSGDEERRGLWSWWYKKGVMNWRWRRWVTIHTLKTSKAWPVSLKVKEPIWFLVVNDS